MLRIFYSLPSVILNLYIIYASYIQKLHWFHNVKKALLKWYKQLIYTRLILKLTKVLSRELPAHALQFLLLILKIFFNYFQAINYLFYCNKFQIIEKKKNSVKPRIVICIYLLTTKNIFFCFLNNPIV